MCIMTILHSLMKAPLPDSREMCFAQGKAMVYMRRGDDEHIYTEWADGTMDKEHLATGATVRRLSDGRVIRVPRCAPLDTNSSGHAAEPSPQQSG